MSEAEWLRFVAGARSTMAHFPASCLKTRFLRGFDWVRFAACGVVDQGAR
jgi:hypothetical protein